MRDRELDRVIGIADGVELLVPVLNAHDDLDGVLFVGRRNLDGLEAPFERAVFLDGFAVFAGRGGSDALDFATREGGLENVGRVERAFGRAGTDQSMQLIDEDDAVLVFHQLFHDGLEALLKLTAVFCASDDERQVESEHALVGEETGYITVGDALGQSFDDRGLANAGFADEHRVVLGAAAEDLDDALELSIAAYERIELGVEGGLSEVARELGQ